MMESLGALLGEKKMGFWGKLTSTVSEHFSPKDKKELLDMATSIVQFYKVTKSGGRCKNC